MTVGRVLNLVNICGNFILFSAVYPLLVVLSIYLFYWHDRMRSLPQGVRIWNFEEKKKTKQKQNKNQESFGCVFD